MAQTALLQGIGRPNQTKSELKGEISAKQPTWLTEAIACSVHRVRGTVKRIAFALGVPEHAVYLAADPNHPQPLKAAWIPAIVRETESFAVLDALEAQVGRVAFALPVATDASQIDIVVYTAQVVREFGETLTHVSGALADGTITDRERREIAHDIGDVHAALAALQLLIEQKAGQ